MTYHIQLATGEELPEFFDYLNDQLRDNGANGVPLFMPMARGDSRFPAEKREHFRAGLVTSLTSPGWRRVWLARTDAGAIAGHIDLRARAEPLSAHRALLGMGVHRDHRGQGLGKRLIEVACEWALADSGTDYIDLEVLSVNQPARALYARCGFVQTGEVPDLFRIDGEAHGDVLMSRRLR